MVSGVFIVRSLAVTYFAYGRAYALNVHCVHVSLRRNKQLRCVLSQA